MQAAINIALFSVKLLRHGLALGYSIGLYVCKVGISHVRLNGDNSKVMKKAFATVSPYAAHKRFNF